MRSKILSTLVVALLSVVVIGAVPLERRELFDRDNDIEGLVSLGAGKRGEDYSAPGWKREDASVPTWKRSDASAPEW